MGNRQNVCNQINKHFWHCQYYSGFLQETVLAAHSEARNGAGVGRQAAILL
jgi:hypothetical protein